MMWMKSKRVTILLTVILMFLLIGLCVQRCYYYRKTKQLEETNVGMPRTNGMQNGAPESQDVY